MKWDPRFQPLSTSASFVERNKTMKELVKLGVDLSELEQNRDVVDFLLAANFEKDITPFIQFLADVGVHPSQIGRVITKHPVLFDELIVNLRTRIEYLIAKNFRRSWIVGIITKHPPYLGKAVKDVDSRLGHLQKEFKFSPSEIRHVLKEYPQIVSLDSMEIKSIALAITEDMGFTPEQMRKMLVEVPSLFGGERESMVGIFDQLYNVSKIEHEIMVDFPSVFLGNFETIRKRTTYLRILKRDQFDSRKPRFVPLSVLSEGDDELFVKKYARTDIDDYNYYLEEQYEVN